MNAIKFTEEDMYDAYDSLLYKGVKPVCISLKTSSRERYKQADLEAMGIAVFDGGHPETLKEQNYAFVVKNPGIPYRYPAATVPWSPGQRCWARR